MRAQSKFSISPKNTSLLTSQVRQAGQALLLQRIALEPVHVVRRAIADLAAAIAKHALPHNEWPELLGTVHQWSQVRAHSFPFNWMPNVHACGVCDTDAVTHVQVTVNMGAILFQRSGVVGAKCTRLVGSAALFHLKPIRLGKVFGFGNIMGLQRCIPMFAC